MKALKIILGIVVVLVIIGTVISLIAPTEYKSSRSIVIKAPKAVIWKNVSLYANRNKWSPWVERDPNMKMTLDGTDGTVGTKHSWEGNKEVGKGSETFTKIDEMSLIESHLHFLEPWEAESDAFVSLKDTNDGVIVTWGFAGKMPRPWNIISVFMNMDAEIGKDFTHGLGKLKTLCESEAAASPVYEIHETTFEPRTYIGKRAVISWMEMKEFFGSVYPKLFKDLSDAKATMVSAPSGLYYTWDEKNMKTDCAAAIAVDKALPRSEWKTFPVKGGKALMIDYYDAYEKSMNAHNQMDQYIKKNNLLFIPPVIEEYITDPMTEKDTSKWLTRIVYFVK